MVSGRVYHLNGRLLNPTRASPGCIRFARDVLGRCVARRRYEGTLENSLCFAVYETPSDTAEADKKLGSAPGKLIGFARCITDYTTFLYLTDVWVDPVCQGKGIGKWLIQSVQETIEKIPYLRRSLLFTGDWTRSVPFYERLMGMSVMETHRGTGLAIMEGKGPKHPNVNGNRPDYP